MAAPLTEEDLLEFLECARYGEIEDVLELLKLGADVNYKDGAGSTALHKAAANGHIDVVKVLIDNGATFTANNSGNTPLHWAALNGHTETGKLLIERFDANIDVLARNSFGKSALTEALSRGHAELGRIILSHRSADASAAKPAGGDGSGAGGFEEVSDDEDVDEEDEAGEEEDEQTPAPDA